MLKVRESVLSTLFAGLLAVVGPFAVQVESSWAVPVDFDGDGISDLTTSSPLGKQLQWKTRHSSTQQEVDLGVFGGVEDLPVPGPWLRNGTQLGVVSLERNAVIWSVLNNGSVESKRWKSCVADMAGSFYRSKFTAQNNFIWRSRRQSLLCKDH
jgi:hypothetical protein